MTGNIRAFFFSVDTKITPIWNTMAALPGRLKDEVVILGCHRDGQWFIGTNLFAEVSVLYSLGHWRRRPYIRYRISTRGYSRSWCIS